MRTQSQKNIELAQDLFNAIELRKELEKKEKELKEQIKLIMGEEKLLEAGSIFITLDDRERTDLDKKAMIQELGMDLIKRFEKTSSFVMMSVKQK